MIEVGRIPEFLVVGALTTVLACGGEMAEETGGVDAREEAEPTADQQAGQEARDVAADLQGTAPDTYRALFETSEGDFVVEVHREWATHGADRFYNLVRGGYYDGARFFRVIDGFMAQFGIPSDPGVAARMRSLRIPDDTVVQGNTRGRLTFAHAGAGTRTSQVFINYGDNTRLDAQNFPAFGEIVEGMEVVDALHSGYGDGPPGGAGPSQSRIQAEGNAYLEEEFPELDYIERATIIEP